MTKKNPVDPFDAIVEELQAEIDIKDHLDFSEYALKLGRHPYHNTPLPNGENVFSYGWRGPCGDSIQWYLEIIEKKIVLAHFTTDGCTTASIVGSQTALMIEMKSVDQIRKLTEAQVLTVLGNFPKEDYHCITLALTSLNLTLDRYEEQKLKKSN